MRRPDLSGLHEWQEIHQDARRHSISITSSPELLNDQYTPRPLSRSWYGFVYLHTRAAVITLITVQNVCQPCSSYPNTRSYLAQTNDRNKNRRKQETEDGPSNACLVPLHVRLQFFQPTTSIRNHPTVHRKFARKSVWSQARKIVVYVVPQHSRSG
jgi:hypothetical protein